MCSVTWSLSDTGYQVFFNRDEQRSRALALPPAIYDRQGVAVMMPLDPQGQGSWISLNQFGLSLCLLNNYQGRVPDGTLISRGLLLKSLRDPLRLNKSRLRLKNWRCLVLLPSLCWLLILCLLNSKVRYWLMHGMANNFAQA